MQSLKEAFKKALQEKHNARADVQRDKQMTGEQRARRAIDIMVGHQKTHAEAHGQPFSEDQARRYVTNIAENAEKAKER